MTEFPFWPLAAGLGLAAMAGPLGSFVVWRRMAYFGDALAHSALLGVAVGFLFGVHLSIGIFAVCVLFALAIAFGQRQRQIATDTLLGILAHGTLALGLVIVAMIDGLDTDLESYLFGDVFAVTAAGAARIFAGAVVALIGLGVIWRPLLAITVHEKLARVEGVAVERTLAIFMVLIALVIALAMKIVGVLLITSLLIIPAATARRFARSPEQMAVLAVGAASAAVTFGLLGAQRLSTPPGPSIVVAAAALYLLSVIVPMRRLVR
ncbi:MAG: metal ABC transporter permease [Sphingomonadales bacterium]